MSAVLHLPEEDASVKKKAPMMNIRFSPENYDYLRSESSIRGLSVTAFVNWIVDAYRKNPKNVHKNPYFENPSSWE